MNELFPIFLKLDRLNTLVVGGGNVALEKASALLRNSPAARVTLVAPMFREDTLEFLKGYPQVMLFERGFELADLDGRDLVICATDNRSCWPSCQDYPVPLRQRLGLLVPEEVVQVVQP
jgi:siroheme synthase (precorrin-2 oxidase/ferrochelatase)